ncbi:MAG: PaaI family thioesterase [Spirochaetaceae bacterium]|nr:MAG: PaaI family thioesterase [Spirochaetaceae bacterium]
MKQKVVAKQPNSKMCYVCGLKNPKGLQASFYELENGEVVGQFVAGEELQGYPDRLHGCIAVGLLDEAIGRAIRTHYDEEAMGQTVELHIRYRIPVPLNQPLRIVARVTRDIRRLYEGSAELKLSDGTVAVEASGKYFSLVGDTLPREELKAQEWKVYPTEHDPRELDI